MSEISLWRCHAQLLGMAVFWGASWSWGRIVVQAMPPLTAGALRFLLASVLLCGWLLYCYGMAPLKALRARQWLGLALAAAFGVCGYAVCFMYALQQVPAGKAATVVALNPVPPLLLAAWLFGERLNGRMLLGMLLAVCGALLAISRGAPLALLTGKVGQGEYLLLCTVLCWSAYTLLGRVLLKGIAPLVTTLCTALLGGLMLLATAGVVEGWAAWAQVLAAPPRAHASLFGLASAATALAYLWFFAGIGRIGVGKASAYMALVPLFAILVATLWLGEALHVSLWFGGVLVVGGMLLMNLGRPEERRG